MSIEKVLKEHGVEKRVQGSRGTKHKEIASDLLNGGDQDRILTKHGARLVMEAKQGRKSWKTVCAGIAIEAERMVAQERRARELQIETLERRVHELESNGTLEHALDGSDDDETAGN
jgi:hypothetical protein